MDAQRDTKMDEPAFPNTGEGLGREFAHPGMSLRDYFAAKAMQGLLAGQWNTDKDRDYPALVEDNRDALVANAYALADAMLAERSRV